MTSRDFCYWLQGYFEISESSHKEPGVTEPLGAEKVACIKRHLAMVFEHEIDPSMGDRRHQAALSEIHNPHLAPIEPSATFPAGLTLKC
jgi:hypothetical protein